MQHSTEYHIQISWEVESSPPMALVSMVHQVIIMIAHLRVIYSVLRGEWQASELSIVYLGVSDKPQSYL